MKARIVAFGCVHAPHSPEHALAFAVNVVKHAKPTHIVCTGDLFEAAAASVHNEEHEHDLIDEYETAAAFLERIHAVAPRAEKHWTLGNHDDNLLAADRRRVPKPLRRAVEWNHSAYRKTFEQWQARPHTKDKAGVAIIGPVHVYHGFRCGRNSDNIEAVEMAMICRAPYDALMIRSHTHQPLYPTRCEMNSADLPWWYLNVGTLGPLRPEYAKKRNTQRWGHAVAVVEVNGSKWNATLERL